MPSYPCSAEITYDSTPFAVGELVAPKRIQVNALRHFHVAASVAPIWVKMGDSTVLATHGAGGEELVPEWWVGCFMTAPGQTHVSVIEDGPNAAVAGGSLALRG